MKKIIILFVILFYSSITFSKTTKSSCCTSPTAEFALMSNDKTFEAAHLAPLAFNFEATKGKFITYKTTDTVDARAFFVPSDSESNKYLFVIHEWWGLNDYIQREAETMQQTFGNVNVLALDLYDGKVAATPDDAGKYMRSVTDERAKAIINGAMAYVGKNAGIATVGWCFGGGWSLQTSLLAGKQAIGCVMYYGMPESDSTKLKSLNCDVLGIFANKDKWITPAVVADFAKNMKNVGKKFTVLSYDADHAFANPSNPKYDKDATADAAKNVNDFLKKIFSK